MTESVLDKLLDAAKAISDRIEVDATAGELGLYYDLAIRTGVLIAHDSHPALYDDLRMLTLWAFAAAELRELRAQVGLMQAGIDRAEKQITMMRGSAAVRAEQLGQAKENAQMLYMALSKHAPDALKELAPRLHDNVNEADKVLCEVTAAREDAARLRQANADLRAELAQCREAQNRAQGDAR